MPKELYLYSPIYDFVAQDLIAAMEDNSGEDIVVRVNSPGGSVLSGWGIIAKMTERKNKTTIKVDGSAMSMAAMALLFADNVEALDVSTIMLHRASMYVSSPKDQEFLDKVNKDLRSKMESKIDGEKLKELKGVSIKDLFDSEEKIDLHLTAKEAKQIGLVDKINKLDPKEASAYSNYLFSVAASAAGSVQKNKNHTTMNVEKLKIEHPEVYAQVIQLGIDQERDRVGACLAFIDVDPVGVKAAIDSGKPLTLTQHAEFSRKAFSIDSLKKANAESAKHIQTTESSLGNELTPEARELADFEAKVKQQLSKKQ